MKDDFFKAIADPNRRKILYLLKKHTIMTPGEISDHFQISKAALSDHLKILRHADLVSCEKKGQYLHYQLNTSVFEDIISAVMSFINDREEKDGKTEEI